MNKNPYDWIDHSLSVIHRAHWTRAVKPIEISQAGGAEIVVKGRALVNFASQ